MSEYTPDKDLDIIDIDESLRAIDTDPTMTIMIDDIHGFVLRVDPRRQLRLLQKHVNPQLQVDEKTLNHILKLQSAKGKDLETEDLEGFDGSFQMGGTEDYYGLGLALVEYVEEWIGFKGNLDKKKLRKWLEHFSDYTQAIGRHFKTYLTEYQKQRLVYMRHAEKN